jgi:pyruvate formate lyase activating enzyme
MASRKSAHGVIFDLVRYAIHDGPGIRTTVFFKGCPLSCEWCQNPESLNPQPEMITGFYRPKFLRLFMNGSSRENMVGHDVTVSSLMTEIIKDWHFYERSGGGVTFSGGEPLMQPVFLKSLLRACRRARIRTALDTSGYAPWSVLRDIQPLVDLFLYDIKIVNEAEHIKYTGVSNRLILDNLRRLVRNKARVCARFPVIPGITDRGRDLRAIAGLIASLRSVEAVSLLPYNFLCPDKYRRMQRKFHLTGLKPPTPSRLQTIKKELLSSGIPVRIGG